MEIFFIFFKKTSTTTRYMADIYNYYFIDTRQIETEKLNQKNKLPPKKKSQPIEIDFLSFNKLKHLIFFSTPLLFYIHKVNSLFLLMKPHHLIP